MISSPRTERAGLTNGYRPDVDGLRGIAVLAVVAYHAGLERVAGGGYVGVDVFFVVSGYLITRLLADEYRRDASLNLPAFYARRARRLLPALYVLIVAVVFASSYCLTPIDGGPQAVARSALAGLVFLANHWFLAHTGGYFDESAHNMPLLHVWSLSVEEQFYLAWPLLLLAAFRAHRWLDPRLAVALAGLASGLTCVWLSASWRAGAFYLMAARAWELAIGAFLALSPPPAETRSMKRLGGVLGMSGLAMVLLAVWGFSISTPYPGVATLVPVMGTAAVIAGNSLAPRSLARRLLSLKPLVGVGLVSYSLYLCHWPLLVLGRSRAVDDSMAPLTPLTLAGLSIGVALLSYRFVEMPGRQSDWVLRRSSRQVLFLAVAAGSVVAMSAGVLGYWARRVLVTEHGTAELHRHRLDVPDRIRECHLDGSRDGAQMPPSSCLESPERTTVVVVWGDSHALAWVPFAHELAESKGSALARFTRDSCPPVLDRLTDLRSGAVDCERFNESVWARLKTGRLEGRRIAAVVLSARWNTYVAEPYSRRDRFDRRYVPPQAGARQRIQVGIAATLRRLDAAGLPVYWMQPTPELRAEAWRCILREQEDYCAMPRAVYNERRAWADAVLEAAAAGLKSVHRIDPADFFCDATACPARKDGRVLFWDDDHVSATASRAFFEFADQQGLLP